MKAQDMVQVVEKAQRELRDEIGALIEAKLDAISAETGLTIDGVEVGIVEATNLSSTARQWRVGRVSVLYALPNMISLEWP